tara:strand:- start:15 stop:293 length:279 start_codon:yes stop_codon:yes gene_type:complete
MKPLTSPQNLGDRNPQSIYGVIRLQPVDASWADTDYALIKRVPESGEIYYVRIYGFDFKKGNVLMEFKSGDTFMRGGTIEVKFIKVAYTNIT